MLSTIPPLYQVVHWVVRLDFAYLNQSLSESGHDVLHQVVAEWNGLGFKHLLLFSLYLFQLGILQVQKYHQSLK